MTTERSEIWPILSDRAKAQIDAALSDAAKSGTGALKIRADRIDPRAFFGVNDAHDNIAQDNARRIAERQVAENDARLQRRADEEGCGALLGALLADVWEREERRPKKVRQTVTGGSLTKVFDAVAKMRAKRPWRVVEPPRWRKTEPGGIVWDVVLELEE